MARSSVAARDFLSNLRKRGPTQPILAALLEFQAEVDRFTAKASLKASLNGSPGKAIE